MWGCQVRLCLLLKNYYFTLTSLDTLVKIQVTLGRWIYFLTLILFIYLCIYHYTSTAVSSLLQFWCMFWNQDACLSMFFLLFWVFKVLASLYKLYGDFIYFWTKADINSIRIKSAGQIGGLSIFININFPINKCVITIYLKSVSICYKNFDDFNTHILHLFSKCISECFIITGIIIAKEIHYQFTFHS